MFIALMIMMNVSTVHPRLPRPAQLTAPTNQASSPTSQIAAVESTSVLRGRRRSDDYVVRHIEQMTPLAESPPETMLRVQLANAGFVVTPQLVVPVCGGREFRLDLGVAEPSHPELVVGVEYDGEAKYQGHSTLLAEKHHEDAIREQGIPVVRVTSADLRDVGALAVRIRHISRQFHNKLRSA